MEKPFYFEITSEDIIFIRNKSKPDKKKGIH